MRAVHFFLVLSLATLASAWQLYEEELESIDNERIVNGKNATQGQFPYQVSWCYDTDVYCFNFCGGSIYTETTIITAAHCCEGIGTFSNDHNETVGWEDTKIVAGELDVLYPSGFEQIRKIKSHIMHPDYNSTTYHNDICLLTLDSPLEFDENVDRVFLDAKAPVVDATCQVSGWGDQEVSSLIFVVDLCIVKVLNIKYFPF